MPPARQPTRTGLRRSARAAILAVLTVGLAAGCATFRSHPDQNAETTAAPITLFVKNYNWSTIHVYVMGSGQTVSLGQITSMDTATFEVPHSALATGGTLRLIADPIGSTSGYISEPVIVAAGDRIEWTIQNRLSQSSVVVR
jgi:hypothetical protein